MEGVTQFFFKRLYIKRLCAKCPGGEGDAVADHVYFEDFDVDLDTGEIRRQGVRVRLRGKPCRILVTLLRQPGEIVPRQQLIDSLWSSNTFVDFDSNLKTALSNLRRVLGDSADYPRFVETVQGVGYRFFAEPGKKSA